MELQRRVMSSPLSARFSLPTQDRSAPSQFQATPGALTAWLETLPKTNLGQTTRALFEVITELNHVRLLPGLRLQLLDTLRPAIYYAVSGLRRHYLNQPIVLPDQAQKVAKLAHILFQEMVTGYLLTATQTLENEPHSGLSHPRQGIAIALHRALADTAHNLLRDSQLYHGVRRGTWHTLHQIAALAWEQQLERLAVADPQSGDSTLEAAYLRGLLIGSSRTYQLRQEDQTKIFDHLLEWSRLASLCGRDEGLFIIDPASDDGPIYRLYMPTASTDSNQVLGFDTRALGEHLRQLRGDDEALIADQQLSNDLLSHLTQSWTIAPSRAHERTAVAEPIELSLGLTATHHFCAGEIDFALLLSKDGYIKVNRQEENPFLRSESTPNKHRTPDVWDSPYQNRSLANISNDSIDYTVRSQHKAVEQQKSREKFHFYPTETINISPGGYCLHWTAANAPQIRTGEIIGIRERNHKNWSVGVVRWVRLHESGPQLGIELLSPTATPFGARVIQKTGPQGEYQRVLVLPEIKQTGQPTTMITPRLPFRSGQKVVMVYRDKETRIQLVRRLQSSAAFSQFEFRRLGASPPAPAPDSPVKTVETGFDSLWDSL